MVGCSDVSGALRNESGIDVQALVEHAKENGSIESFEGDAEQCSAEELLATECDVLFPAALGGMIHRGNADMLRCKLVVEGANSPTTPNADEVLYGNHVHVVPDVMANAGGVIVSYFEWVQNLQHFRWEEDAVNHQLETIMRRAYREVSSKAQEDGVSLRLAAYQMGIERVVEAARTRGYIP